MRHQATLKFIDAIARASSIRRASEQMSITPSALNRRLLAVEEEMGVDLFERTSSGVRLSAAGELFLAHARRQMADMERIQSQIEDMKGARRGHVSFGFDQSLMMEDFSEAIGGYQSAFPEVTFRVDRLSREDVQRGLVDYRVDLAGVIQPEAYPNMMTLAVAPLDIVAVMRPSHPLAKQASLSFNELLHYPITLPVSGSLRDILDGAARRQDHTLQPILECELPFATHVLQNGDTVGFAANTATRNLNGLHGMICVPLNTRDVLRTNIHLIQLRGRTLSVAASRFADRIVHRFAQYSGEL